MSASPFIRLHRIGGGSPAARAQAAAEGLRLWQLTQDLVGDGPDRKAPPLERRGQPADGLNLARTRNMEHHELTNHIEARPLATALQVSQTPLELLIHEGRQLVTPALARRITEEATFRRQRPIKSHHVEFLAQQMRHGRFTSGTQIVFVRLPDGQFYFVNGYHRMHAQIRTGKSIEYQILIHDAEDEEEIIRFYYRQDRGQRVRSEAEVLAAVGAAEKYNLTKTMTRAVFQAQPLIDNNFVRPTVYADPTARDDDLRLEACRPWWAVAAEYEALIKGAPTPIHSRLTSSQAAAVGLITIKYQPEKAVEFWRGLAMDDGLRRDDPRKALLIDFGWRKWLKHGSDGCVVISLAWNAFYAGRTLQQIKIVQDAGKSVRIAGTPFNGRRA